jgi:hypothetical protein
MSSNNWRKKGFWLGRADVRRETNDYEDWWETSEDLAHDYYLQMLGTRPEITAVVYPSIYGIWDMPWPIDRWDLKRWTDFQLAFKHIDEVGAKEYEVWLRQ